MSPRLARACHTASNGRERSIQWTDEDIEYISNIQWKRDDVPHISKILQEIGKIDFETWSGAESRPLA